MAELINWLLEEDNPAVRYRTQTEILNLPGNKSTVIKWIFTSLPQNWHETSGLWYVYYLTALAECGLSRTDIRADQLAKAFEMLEGDFSCGCADFMLLTALIRLGCAEHPAVRTVMSSLGENRLPDGGFVCQRQRNKRKYTPKSCYKDALHALFFVSACAKQGMDIREHQPLIDYFLKRNLFYRSDDSTKLVIDAREGWRTIDTFHPYEPMRVGIHNVVESFCALGYGSDERLREAWNLLQSRRDVDGKVLLQATLTKSYLPQEHVGRPSKWVTFYTLLAEKERNK